jgi:chromosome segregation ATPase
LVLAVAFGIIALEKGSQNLSRIHRLEGQVLRLSAHTGGAQATVTSRLAAVEGKLTTLEGSAATSTAKLTKAEGTLGKLVSCVPELQTQIGGLEIKGETYSASYIRDSTNVSHECSPILYGTGK